VRSPSRLDSEGGAAGALGVVDGGGEYVGGSEEVGGGLGAFDGSAEVVVWWLAGRCPRWRCLGFARDTAGARASPAETGWDARPICWLARRLAAIETAAAIRIPSRARPNQRMVAGILIASSGRVGPRT
jgi:hypothetical protein